MNASAVADANRNAEINGIKNCRFVCSKAEDVMGSLLKEYLTKKVDDECDSGINDSDVGIKEEAVDADSGVGLKDVKDEPVDIKEGLKEVKKEESNCETDNSDTKMPNSEGIKEVKKEEESNCENEESKSKIHRFENVVAIVDPPRVGLHPTVIKALRTHSHLRRLVYISCNPESLMANAIELCTPSADKSEKGNKNNRGWRNMSSAGLARHRAKSMPTSEPFHPVKAMAVDLFPHTPHCELVMLLER